jgi:4-hydroxy-tetrahydrodipicolinate reductase
MKVLLVGYGKMGRLLETRLTERGHQVLAVADPACPGTPPPSGAEQYTSLSEALNGAQGKSLKDADVAIEFSLPRVAPENLLFLAREKIPVVTGTTGWYERMDEVKGTVEKAGGALLWASNFSIGVNLFYRVAWYGAQLINNFPEYDAGGFEAHHNKKIDSPSGTAKTLAEGALSRIDRKKKIVWETMNRKPQEDELHFPSLRLGSVPGQHSLFFDSPADTIEITHTTRNREGLASGAVQAAKWLTAEKRRGVFTMDEMLKEILGN